MGAALVPVGVEEPNVGLAAVLADKVAVTVLLPVVPAIPVIVLVVRLLVPVGPPRVPVVLPGVRAEPLNALVGLPPARVALPLAHVTAPLAPVTRLPAPVTPLLARAEAPFALVGALIATVSLPPVARLFPSILVLRLVGTLRAIVSIAYLPLISQ